MNTILQMENLDPSPLGKAVRALLFGILTTLGFLIVTLMLCGGAGIVDYYWGTRGDAEDTGGVTIISAVAALALTCVAMLVAGVLALCGWIGSRWTWVVLSAAVAVSLMLWVAGRAVDKDSCYSRNDCDTFSHAGNSSHPRAGLPGSAAVQKGVRGAAA